MDRDECELGDTGLDEFELKFIKLLRLCERLKTENRVLRDAQEDLQESHDDLFEKNELARRKVSSILARLKQPELEGTKE